MTLKLLIMEGIEPFSALFGNHRSMSPANEDIELGTELVSELFPRFRYLNEGVGKMEYLTQITSETGARCQTTAYTRPVRALIELGITPDSELLVKFTILLT